MDYGVARAYRIRSLAPRRHPRSISTAASGRSIGSAAEAFEDVEGRRKEEGSRTGNGGVSSARGGPDLACERILVVLITR